MSRSHRTHVSDARDSRRKIERARELAESDPLIAVRMANAIAANPRLLDGLSAIVGRLAKVEEAAVILEDVFNEHGRTYPRTYLAFVEARLMR